MSLTIRALDPAADRELFREAYNWRTKKRLAHDPEGIITFEDFAHPEPNETDLGLFNGQLLAVFTIQDRGQKRFEVHFTVKPQVPRDAVVAGALTIKNWLFENGAKEVYGWLREKHFNPRHPVRKFAESVGFFPENNCQVRTNRDTLRTYWWRKFVARR